MHLRSLFFLALMLISCGGEVVITPKPRTYPRVNYPTKSYETATFDQCPFAAEIPIYSELKEVEKYRGKKSQNDCWYNVNFPSLNATLYLSYVPMSSFDDFAAFRDDSYDIVNQINKNSDYMQEIPFTKGENTGGIVFDFEGPAASPFQFFITDSTRHNLRGALYINSEVKPDSLAPIIDFLERDVKHFINTFHWKGTN